jgi:hypothetical protein
MLHPCRRSCGRSTAPPVKPAPKSRSRRSRGAKYPTVVESWRRAWEHVIPFFAFPPEVRRMIYTTNVIERLHRYRFRAVTRLHSRRFPLRLINQPKAKNHIIEIVVSSTIVTSIPANRSRLLNNHRGTTVP